MKPNTEPESDRPLNDLLRQWTVDTPLPPRFQDQVWQRIDRAEAQSKPAFRSRLSRLLEVVLPRPRYAFSYLAILLALGVVGGSWAAQVKTTHLDSVLRQRYVQSIDPYRTDLPQR